MYWVGTFPEQRKPFGFAQAVDKPKREEDPLFPLNLQKGEIIPGYNLRPTQSSQRAIYTPPHQLEGP